MGEIWRVEEDDWIKLQQNITIMMMKKEKRKMIDVVVSLDLSLTRSYVLMIMYKNSIWANPDKGFEIVQGWLILNLLMLLYDLKCDRLVYWKIDIAYDLAELFVILCLIFVLISFKIYQIWLFVWHTLMCLWNSKHFVIWSPTWYYDIRTTLSNVYISQFFFRNT